MTMIMKRLAMTTALITACFVTACSQPQSSEPASSTVKPPPASQPVEDPKPEKTEDYAVFGAGCFWCVEAVLEQLKGVTSVVSGYTGGHVLNPTYDDILTKKSGHVEVAKVEFNPQIITYDELLTWFWKLHDPTSWDKQGPDSGPQYRSVVFFHSDEQRDAAKTSMSKAQANYESKIVTEIRKLDVFYPAEDFHQDYYPNGSHRGYINGIIRPKLRKLGLKE